MHVAEILFSTIRIGGEFLGKKAIVMLVVTGILLIVSFLVFTSSYFNNQEIGSLTFQCFKNNGEPTLKINNALTNNYSFVCRNN